VQLNAVDPSGGPEKLVWDTGKLGGNRSVYTATQPVVSDTAYHWRVRVWVAGSDNATAWTDAMFSTALLEQSDWTGSEWISPPVTTQMASQMRKEFDVPAGAIVSARAFVALPGYGTVSVNGQRIDGEAGTRSLSQYDVRMLYQTFDIAPFLVAGKTNVVAIYVGLGWWGHPAVPPQAQRFPFGPPTVRAQFRVNVGGKTTVLNTDDSWMQAEGPYTYDDNYNGVVYDARLATPG
jgi:alpha-L-rhamnosidase